MASDALGPRLYRLPSPTILDSASDNVGPDPFSNPVVRDLLQQQADIQARLASLVPTEYAPNNLVELDMLRQKLRVLQAAAESHRTPTPLPTITCTRVLP